MLLHVGKADTCLLPFAPAVHSRQERSVFPDSAVMNQYYPAAFIPHSLNVCLWLSSTLLGFFCPPPSNVFLRLAFLNMLAVICEACHFPHPCNLRLTTDTCFKALRSKLTRILFSCFSYPPPNKSPRNKFGVRLPPTPLWTHVEKAEWAGGHVEISFRVFHERRISFYNWADHK